jgi:hypothetical protein
MEEESPNVSDGNEILSVGEFKVSNAVVSSTCDPSEVTESMCLSKFRLLLTARDLGIEAPMKTDRKSVPEMRSSLLADLAIVCLAKGSPRTG